MATHDDLPPVQPAPQSFPSLDVIRAELDLRLAEQERRGTAFDTRAGLILAFGGVLIGLSAQHPSALQLLGQVAAAAAAGVAGWSLWPRVSGAVGPRALRNRYLTTPPEATKLALLDTRIFLYEQDEQRLESKVTRLRYAVWILSSSVLFMLAASIVEYVR